MAQQAPLALTDVAHGEQKGWRRNTHLVDALPYVDGLSPAEKAAVDKLIEEEMRNSSKKPSDYLSELPPLPEPRFKGDELLEKEMARVAGGESMQAMDTARYNLAPPPPSKRNDFTAWRAALDNAYAQLEHQYNRLLNLELLLKFGPDSWRMHNEGLSAFVARLQGQLAGVRRQVDALNRERKLQQSAAGAELSQLEAEYLGLVHRNAEIEAACRGLEAEVAAMRDALPRVQTNGSGGGSGEEGTEGAAAADGPQQEEQQDGEEAQEQEQQQAAGEHGGSGGESAEGDTAEGTEEGPPAPQPNGTSEAMQE